MRSPSDGFREAFKDTSDVATGPCRLTYFSSCRFVQFHKKRTNVNNTNLILNLVLNEMYHPFNQSLDFFEAANSRVF